MTARASFLMQSPFRQPRPEFSAPLVCDSALTDALADMLLHDTPGHSEAVSADMMARAMELHSIKGFLRAGFFVQYPAVADLEDSLAVRVCDDADPPTCWSAAIDDGVFPRMACLQCSVNPAVFAVCGSSSLECPRRSGMCEPCLDSWVMQGPLSVPSCPRCRGNIRRPARFLMTIK